MDKLNQLLSGDVLDFATTFGAATREWIGDNPSPDCPVWLEGWVAPARAGYVLGDGEFIHDGQPRRVYFSGLPLRHGQGARLSGTGTIVGLHRLRDFSGVYIPCDGAPSRSGLGSEARLRNANGVVISLSAADEDWLVELPCGGLRVRLTTDL
jgi:hypothetical protein